MIDLHRLIENRIHMIRFPNGIPVYDGLCLLGYDTRGHRAFFDELHELTEQLGTCEVGVI